MDRYHASALVRPGLATPRETDGRSSHDRMFVIVAGPAAESVGSVGYWEQEWRGEMIWETGWSVLPDFQGQGLATRGVAAAIERARAERTHQSIHAFPSVHNLPSNAICQKTGFTLLGEIDFEYPPGKQMRCNDWSLNMLNTPDGWSTSNQGASPEGRNAPLGLHPLRPHHPSESPLVRVWRRATLAAIV